MVIQFYQTYFAKLHTLKIHDTGMHAHILTLMFKSDKKPVWTLCTEIRQLNHDILHGKLYLHQARYLPNIDLQTTRNKIIVIINNIHYIYKQQVMMAIQL